MSGPLAISRCQPVARGDSLVWKWAHRGARYELEIRPTHEQSLPWLVTVNCGKRQLWECRPQSLVEAIELSKKKCLSLGSGSWEV